MTRFPRPKEELKEEERFLSQLSGSYGRKSQDPAIVISLFTLFCLLTLMAGDMAGIW